MRVHIVSQENKIHDGCKATDPDPAPTAKVHDWLHYVQMKSGDERPKEYFVGVSDLSDEEAEGSKIPEDLPRYRDFVTRNPAYAWLLARLERELLLVPAAPNHMQTISGTILNSLSHGAFQKLGHEKGPHLCEMTFIVDWDPLAFLKEQEYEEKAEEAFARAITLTGTGRDAQALTTAQYLSQTWPLVGDEVLDLLKRVIRCGSGSTAQLSKHWTEIVLGREVTTNLYRNRSYEGPHSSCRLSE